MGCGVALQLLRWRRILARYSGTFSPACEVIA